MREIKFRAWDKDSSMMMYSPLNNYDDFYFDFDKSGHLKLFGHIEDNYPEKRDAVIQQFTGLKDKNGKEIYEGDVVKWGHARELSRENPIRIAEVKINPDIQFHSQVGVFKFGNFAYADSIDRDLEVIGNIFENPDLIN